jgi:hypothetical protein
MILVQAGLNAQVNDAEFWENFNVEHKLSPALTARFSHEGRFTDNYSRLTYFFEDVGMEYKIPKTHFGMLADYVYIRKHVPENYWSNRHQFYTAITYAHKLGPIQLHDRQMLMAQVKDVKSSANGKVPDWYLRNKLTAKYSFNFYWSVYVAEELYWHVHTANDGAAHTNRVRYFAGMFFRPDKRSEFELYYLIEQHMNIANPNHNYVFGAGYTLTI